MSAQIRWSFDLSRDIPITTDGRVAVDALALHMAPRFGFDNVGIALTAMARPDNGGEVIRRYTISAREPAARARRGRLKVYTVV